jgi:hypothetical protein
MSEKEVNERSKNYHKSDSHTGVSIGLSGAEVQGHPVSLLYCRKLPARQ